jgi:L-cysteine:1D-myo-inositol 2-amino-2-deoxy-alpha-D-glucopyranoside ligase
MQLYNALSQKVEPFTVTDGRISVYVCGITPYDTTHMGHCFTYATFDILIRYLEYLGYPVVYTQNVTDIDDDILRKAGQVGEDWRRLGNRWTAHFIDDNQALNMRPPDYFPRATEVIPEIVTAVQALLTAGVAYEAAGNVYFHVASDPDYGKLSRLSPDEMLPVANERGNKPDDPHKHHPLDFVLWQAQTPGEPAWDSPWGLGRPGWHIECSTMSDKFLGQPIDIHGGGADLLFPHHESEIAQAESASGREPFARFWMHAAMLHYQGEKMSKSLGNLVMVRDLLKGGWPADAIRLCMARHHYRQAWNYQFEELTLSAVMAAKLKAAVTAAGGPGAPPAGSGVEAAFQAAMDNDLDSPAATQALAQEAEAVVTAAERGRDVSQAQATLRRLAAVLGLRLDRPQPENAVIAGWREHRQRFSDF